MSVIYFRYRTLITFTLLFSLVSHAACQDAYILKNSYIELLITKQGNLKSLINLKTGHNYASGKTLWRIYYDRHNEKDIEILSYYNDPLIVKSGNKIVMSYTDLKVQNGKISFDLCLEIILDENMLRFVSKISNNEPHTIIRELQYPLIGDCNMPDDHMLLTTLRGGHIYTDPKNYILSLPYTYMGPDHRFRQMNIKYPIGVASNCFALAGDTQGLYFGSHDSTFQDTGHGFRVYPDEKGNFSEFEAGICKYPNCLHGKSWNNDANVLALYNGSWHETSRIYRTWVNTWWEHPQPPQWVKEMTGLQRIILRHQYGETIFTYDDFAFRVKRDGESVGINVAFPFGWWHSGMDNGYPDSYYETDEGQGGDAAWKNAVAKYQKGGGKVLMYFNGKLIDTESNYYRHGDGKEVSYKSNTGTEFTEAYRFSGPGTFTGFYNSRSFVVADTKNPKWQQKLKEMADRAIELGANSIFYDQLGYAESITNWDLSKEFPVPDLRIIANKAEALKMIHNYIDSIDKDFAIGTEHITDVTSQYVDYVHGIFHVGSWTAKNQTNFIDWFRYTFPEIILTDRNVDGDEKNVEWLTNRAVMLGLRTNVQTFRLRGLIEETPRYQQYLAEVNKIKDKYNKLLIQGIYRDTNGFVIENNTCIQARSFIHDNKMAVVMTHKCLGTEEAYLYCQGYKFIEYDGMGDIKVKNENNNKQAVTIGKDGLAVVIYEKIK